MSRSGGNSCKRNGKVKISANGNGNGSNGGNGAGGNGNGANGKSKDKGFFPPNGLPLGLGKLTPQQLAVITALLSNALIVDSVLVDKDQAIQIVLSGSLRRKTKADKLLDEMSDITIGELLDSISNR